ncbi:hypothetical protein [Agrobacterium leguminum]|uniref:hypothetical protein n=1 Tax=Agrobacterium leguminum TaxID=2792015 RepID=UPI003CE5B8CC
MDKTVGCDNVEELETALADLNSSMANSASEHQGTPNPVTTAVASDVRLAQRDAFYKKLLKADAEELKETADRIRERHRSSIIETGEDLLKIKTNKSGIFVRWLEVEFDMSVRTAWNYISVAEQFASTPKVVDVFPPATVYKLAASGTPDAIRKAVVLEVNSGACPTKEDVERRITEARNRARKDRLDARQKLADEKEIAAWKATEVKAWAKREKELKKSGATDEDIATARTAWTNDMEQNEKAKIKALQSRKTEKEREQQKRNENAKRLQEKAYSAVKYLIENFKGDRNRLAELMTGVSPHDVANVLAAAVRA